MRLEEIDRKELILESYRIDGINEAECRSIFLDWALSLPVGIETHDAVRVLLAEYAQGAPDHPMTKVLTEALSPVAPPRRRGGRAMRLSG